MYERIRHRKYFPNFVSDLRSGFQVLIRTFVPRRSKFNIYMINFNTKMRTLLRCSAMPWSTVADLPNVVLKAFGIVVDPDSVGASA